MALAAAPVVFNLDAAHATAGSVLAKVVPARPIVTSDSGERHPSGKSPHIPMPRIRGLE
jgi:hypothetical protein